MPTFATPQPILVTIDLFVGDARISASARTDTVVEVRPRDPKNQNDTKAAANTRVEYEDGKLTIKAPKSLQIYFSSKAGMVDVTVELPIGSQVRGHTAQGNFRCEGELGDCSFKTSSGDIGLGRAGSVRLSTMDGQIIVGRAGGDSHVTGSGEVRIGEIAGTASVKNLNGDSWVGQVSGDISLNSAHGNIAIDRAGANVVARTAHGDVHVGEVARGKVVLQTASGELEVGIRKGTAAWLDVKSSSGDVRNGLASADSPETTDETVEVRARTYHGDITIRRATGN
ncbi:MAG TPA: hypothetical protein DGG94_13550 [Micromonosporaceae bacterium]|nr:hypothetical protein [Micromonosporaceae bacterium]HCU50802.1 hypothetical protein [Micromonosporaceae bacterium]